MFATSRFVLSQHKWGLGVGTLLQRQQRTAQGDGRREACDATAAVPTSELCSCDPWSDFTSFPAEALLAVAIDAHSSTGMVYTRQRGNHEGNQPPAGAPPAWLGRTEYPSAREYTSLSWLCYLSVL